MFALNQQTLADSGANERPPMLEKGNYIPWESRPMIPDLDNTTKQIIEPLSKMTEINKKQYNVDVRVMNYLLQAIPNDIYNSVDLYDSLVQFEPHVQASKVKKAARNHDPLALIAHSNASLSQSHANPSNSHSPQPYYVTHHSSVVDYEEDYQGELQGDSQEDKLTTAMIVDIQTKNAGYGRNGNKNAGRQNKNQAFNAGNGLTQNDESNQIIQVRDAMYFREQMLLAMKDEAGRNLKDEENDFMLNNAYGDDTLKELTAAVNASHIDLINSMISKGVHEHKNHGKCKIVINTSIDDQIDSNIIFDDPYVENNGGSVEHDSTTHDQYHDVKILAYNIQKEAKIQKRLNDELKKQKEFLKKELETFGLGYQNPKRLKKAIATQQKMYHGEMLQSTNLKIDPPDSEETLEDAEESRLKMRNKMIQLDFGKLNALYETFVPQKEPSVEQTYFSIPSTSNDRIDVTLLEDRKRRWMSDSQNSLREFYETDVIPISISLLKTLK
ncbi:hypothetical protein Tco_0688670 [Tanacetum coccineum]